MLEDRADHFSYISALKPISLIMKRENAHIPGHTPDTVQEQGLDTADVVQTLQAEKINEYTPDEGTLATQHPWVSGLSADTKNTMMTSAAALLRDTNLPGAKAPTLAIPHHLANQEPLTLAQDSTNAAQPKQESTHGPTFDKITTFLLEKAALNQSKAQFWTTLESVEETTEILYGLSGEVNSESLGLLQNKGWILIPHEPGLLWDFTDNFAVRTLKEDFKTLWTNGFDGHIQTTPDEDDPTIEHIALSHDNGSTGHVTILNRPELSWVDTIHFTSTQSDKRLTNQIAWRVLMANSLKTARDQSIYAVTGPDHAAEKLGRGALWDSRWIAVKTTSPWVKLLKIYLGLKFKLGRRKRLKLYTQHSPYEGEE